MYYGSFEKFSEGFVTKLKRIALLGLTVVSLASNASAQIECMLYQPERGSSTFPLKPDNCQNFSPKAEQCKMNKDKLADTLRSHTSPLTGIVFHHCGITDTDAIAIISALENNHKSSLKWLNLQHNSISFKGVDTISKILLHQENSSLSVLYLDYNQIGDVGAIAIAKSLETNSTLNELWLINNSITDDGAKAIVQAILANEDSKITYLDLGGNKISGKLRRKLQNEAKKNSNLHIRFEN